MGDEDEAAPPAEPQASPGASDAADVTQELPVVSAPPDVPAEPESDPEPEVSPEPDVSPEPAAETVAEPEVEVEPEPAPEASPEPDADPEAEPEPVTEAAAAASPEPESQAEPVTEAAAAASPEPEPAAVPAAAAVVDGPAHARTGRSAWLTVLTVVVAVIALAAAAIAGVLYGRSTAPGPDIVVQNEPVVEEPSAAEPMAVGVMPSSVSPILTVTGVRAAAPTAVLTAAPGLPDEPGTATGYRLVNTGISGGQVAAVLAGTFGASGSPEQDGITWTVGSPGQPTLRVTADPLFSWSFEDPVRSAAPAVGEQLDASQAIELAGTLLAGIGVDTSSVDWQVDRYVDRSVVIAWQLVGEERTQLAWQVAFDPDGNVLTASGFSAGIEAVPGYAVVGAATAVQRSNAAPWWVLGPALVERAPIGDDPLASEPTSPQSLPAPEDQAGEDLAGEDQASPDPVFGATAEPAPDESVSAPSASPVPPSPSAPSESEAVASEEGSESAPASDPAALAPPLAVPVADVTVVAAELGLAQYWQPDGSVLMLPSYLLTGDDGSRWSLIAVAEQYVDFDPVSDVDAG